MPFHGTYLALVRVPIASLAPNHDAQPPVSFERNTVLGWLLSMAGRFAVTPVIAVPELSLGLAKLDLTQGLATN